MRYIIILLTICAINQASAQRFYAELSRDSILVDNSYTVSFVAEDVDGVFTPPDLSGFRVMSTMTRSSSQFSQGESHKSTTYDYVIYADEMGEFYIPEAEFTSSDLQLFTEPLKVSVHANPDGIKQSDDQDRMFFFETDAFDMDIFKPKSRTPEYKSPVKKSKRKVKRI